MTKLKIRYAVVHLLRFTWLRPMLDCFRRSPKNRAISSEHVIGGPAVLGNSHFQWLTLQEILHLTPREEADIILKLVEP